MLHKVKRLVSLLPGELVCFEARLRNLIELGLSKRIASNGAVLVGSSCSLALLLAVATGSVA